MRFFLALLLILSAPGAFAFSSSQERWVKRQLSAMTEATAQLKARDLRLRRLSRPEVRDSGPRQALAQAALALGVPRERFVVSSAEGNWSDFSGAFGYIESKTVLGDKESLYFAIAHEQAHLVLGHGLKHLKILFMAAALDCYACVSNKDPVEAALAYGATHPEVLESIVREDELVADEWAVRFLADQGLVLNYEKVMSQMHGQVCVMMLISGRTPHASCD